MVKLVKPSLCRQRRIRALAAAAPQPSDAAPGVMPEAKKTASRKSPK